MAEPRYRSREWRIGPLEATPQAVADAVAAMLMAEYRGITVTPFMTTTGSVGLRVRFDEEDRRRAPINLTITRSREP